MNLLLSIILVGSSATFAQKDSQKTPIGEVLYQIIASDGFDAAIGQYKQLKQNEPDKYDFSEAQLNNLGYKLIGENRIDEAIRIFRLNVEAYPESPNTYDSLAEALRLNGKLEESAKLYEKVLAIVDEAAIDPSTKAFLKNNAKAKLIQMREGRQFDFWIGKWAVDRHFLRPDGQWFDWKDTCKTATVADGNAIIDYWDVATSPTRSLFMRTYNMNTNQWEITGMGSRALNGFTIWKGEFKDGRGEFFNERINAQGQQVMTRITFYDIKEDSFLWKFDRSTDSGETWQTTLKNEFKRLDKNGKITIDYTTK